MSFKSDPHFESKVGRQAINSATDISVMKVESFDYPKMFSNSTSSSPEATPPQSQKESPPLHLKIKIPKGNNLINKLK